MIYCSNTAHSCRRNEQELQTGNLNSFLKLSSGKGTNTYCVCQKDQILNVTFSVLLVHWLVINVILLSNCRNKLQISKRFLQSCVIKGLNTHWYWKYALHLEGNKFFKLIFSGVIWIRKEQISVTHQECNENWAINIWNLWCNEEQLLCLILFF